MTVDRQIKQSKHLECRACLLKIILFMFCLLILFAKRFPLLPIDIKNKILGNQDASFENKFPRSLEHINTLFTVL